ncbi:uncharacterized protein ACA1_088780 [Acanthamoeba castellanii str. Neff]|uniref:Uncharacterized protein n=1 Tax=Acanthamoeba castellanii (strain ATCC 30010 / Neff) TaxID=1257118 RepID=L8GUN9_ACACF|nr:uncharacterized protein ACA1_088780 [Acanthamoeba castellanii str. Neff]ELR16632.1 hypothetical protein ACA1_088780 [Acanthamoeba castellanii str. Neff]
MSRPRTPTHTPYLTSPERPQPKRTCRGYWCTKLKPNRKVCGRHFTTLQGYKSHLRSPRKHAATVGPAAPTPQRDDQAPPLTDGPSSLQQLLLLIDIMPLGELVELHYQVAKTVRRRLPAEMAGRGAAVSHGSESVCTSPTPAMAEANQRQQLGTDSEEQFLNDVFALLP